MSLRLGFWLYFSLTVLDIKSIIGINNVGIVLRCSKSVLRAKSLLIICVSFATLFRRCDAWSYNDILVSPCLSPSLITHGVGSWLEAFLWLSIDHRLNDTISIDWYWSIDCFFPSIGHSEICSCESLLFLLSACREVALHMYSKWRQFELHPRSTRA